MYHTLPGQSVFRLHFLLCFGGSGNWIHVCARQVPYCLIELHPSSEMSLLIGLFSHLDLLPKKQSLLQFISVLQPGCLNLFDVFSTYLQLGGQVYGLSAEISHLRLLKTPQPQTAAGSQSTVLEQGRYSVLGTSLCFLYLFTLSFPWENVSPCWCYKEKRQENHRFKACLGHLAQNQFRSSLNKKQNSVLRGEGWRWWPDGDGDRMDAC